jgi:hypothetical protein
MVRALQAAVGDSGDHDFSNGGSGGNGRSDAPQSGLSPMYVDGLAKLLFANVHILQYSVIAFTRFRRQREQLF